MGSYSDWITSRRTLYKTAITNAYSAHQSSAGNDYESAYDSMAAVSQIAALIPPTNNAAFYGSSPNATEAQINTLQTWLEANSAVAAKLNLATGSNATDETGRKSLGNAGNVGSEKRRWKGNPLYTFANGVLVGKNSKIIAALGTNGGASIDGFGTDTLIYFDGIPFSKGTGLPGTAVFAGDLVVSGSIQGTEGIVIIDDVIQLERGVSNPAGIGVDDAGKIRLRHRGEGFLDLVDEVEKAKSGSIEDAKLWVGAQNTSSARWGSSLIPNSNFAQIENSGTGGSYAERPAGVITVGSTSNIINYSSGIVTINPNGKGIAFQAIPVTADRYTVRIRYKGASALTPATQGNAEGLFIGFHETTVEDLGAKLYVYDGSEFSTDVESSKSSDVHTSSVSVTYATGNRSADGSTYDGSPITTSYVVKSYTYSPSSTAKNASLVIHARNYNYNLDIDYIVMTEAPQTSTEITSLINAATSAIDSETGSEIIDAQMGDKSKWAAIGGASLADNANGGDGGSGDAAIEVTCSSSGDGITSTSIDCVSDTYLVGMRIKTSSGTTNISLDGIETAGPYYGTLGSTDPKLLPGAEDYRTKAITLQEIDSDGQPTGSASATKSVTTAWKTLIGTYQPNKLHPTSYATGYTTPTDSTGNTFVLPGKFSLAIRADSAVTFVVDYVYAAVQGSSVNVAQELANSAYGDSQTFVTQINDLLIKESGSIVNNSSMALPSTTSNGPAGYRARGTGATIATVGTGAANKSVKVTSSSAGNLTLISPPFNLGKSDKFSIGVRIKSLESGAVSAKVDVAYTADELPTNKVTLAASGPSDVYSSNTSEVAVTIDDTSDTAGGSISSDKFDVSVGTSYGSILGTWDRKAVDGTYAKKNASIVITATGDFEVDYILVKEQICSFDLADTQAETRRDEAIAQAEGFTTALGEAISAESGSMIQNASFSSWYLNGSSKHRPQGWFTTRGASNPLRVIPATESTDTATQAKENVENVNQQGSAIKFTPSASGGILSRYIQLPAGSTWTNPADDSVTTTTGTYTFAVKVRLSSAEPVGIRLYAHEYYSYVDGAQTHVWCTNGTYGSATYEDSGTPNPKVKTFTDGTSGSDTGGRVARIGPINVTTNDTMPGYNPGGGDYSASGDDQYVEYIPVDNSETDGDIDDTASNFATWYTVAGTYTPHSSTKQVSFEILIDGDPDASDGNIPNVYIDYVNLVPQPFDTDFAQSISEARTQSLTGITSDGTFGDGSRLLAASILDARTRLASAEATLALESPDSSLLPNSFFNDYDGSLPSTPNKWTGTRDAGATVTLKAQSFDSYNTYVELGSNDVAEEIHGMLSRAVAIVGDGVNNFGICGGGLNPTFTQDPDAVADGSAVNTSYPTFDLVCRFRGLTTATNKNTTGVHKAATAYNTRTSGTSSALTNAPTTLKNGLGETLTISGATEYSYDIGDDAHTGTYWDVPWGGDISAAAANATELIVAFSINDSDTEVDPVMKFRNSSNGTVSLSGTIQIWDTSDNLLEENSFTSQTQIKDWLMADNTSASTYLVDGANDGARLWVVVKLSGTFTTLDNIQMLGASGTAYHDNCWVRNFNFFAYELPAAEQVSVTMLAHEFYGTSLDTNKNYVYANGVNYTLNSSVTDVQRYYSGGEGQVVTIQSILSTNDTTLENETSVTSNAWQTLIGQYTPSQSAKWVSFEFIVNEDKDNDNVRPMVLIDGILLQQSDGSSLAQAAKTSATAAQTTANNNSSSITTINTNVGAIQTSVALMKAADDELFLINTAIANEQDSLIQNAGFMNTSASTTTDSESNTVTNMALPGSYLPFKRTGPMVRVQNTDSAKTGLASITHTGTPNSKPYSVQSPYYDFGQSEFCMVVPSINDTDQDVVGFYTSAIVIPNSSGGTTSSGSSSSGTHNNDFSGDVTLGSGGAYSIAFKIKNLDNRTANEDIVASIYAHEYDGGIGPATDGKFIIDTGSSADWDGFDYNTTVATEINKTTQTQTRKSVITVVKLSDANDTSFGSSEDIDDASGWVTIGGTYTATTTAECVSFSLHLDIDKANDNDIAGFTTVTMGTLDDGTGSAANLNPVVAVDFIYCGTQSFTADMAEQIVASRVNTVQAGLKTEISSIESNLDSEGSSLMPNGNFNSKFNDTHDFVKHWIPTGNSSANKLRLYAADSASKSIGTYIKFNSAASGGSAPYGDNKSGIISKAILNPVELVRSPENEINSFNIGMRIRGTTLQTTTASSWSQSYSVGTPTGEWASNQTLHHTKGPDRHTWGTLTQTWSQGGSTLTNVPTGLNGTAVINAVQGSSYGNEKFDSFKDDDSGHYMSYPMNNGQNNQQQLLAIQCSHTSSDTTWALRFEPFNGSTAITTNFSTSLWYTTDAGATWAQGLDQAANTTSYSFASNQLYNANGGYPHDSHLVLILFQANPSSTTAVLPQMDAVRVGSNTLTWYLWCARGALNYYTGPQAGTPNVPDFSIKLRAHESYKAIASDNVVVYDTNSSNLNTSPDSNTGISLASYDATATSPDEGQVTDLNLIDLRYSGSSAGTEIVIDASVVDDDSGEYITDWRHIVGSYTPSENATAVSFEIIIDHNHDNDNTVQEVWLDSITMAASSINRDIAADVADNRVFVEQNFQGGSTPVSPNNVLRNADMSQVQQVSSTYSQGASDDLKRPINWHYLSTDASWTWASTDFIVSPASTSTNRAYRITCKANLDRNGIVSTPFKITSDKYKVRIVHKAQSAAVEEFGIWALCTNQTLQNASAIINTTSDMVDFPSSQPTHYHPVNGDQIEISGNFFKVQRITFDNIGISGTTQVKEFTWTPTISTNSVRPTAANLPEYASLCVVYTETGSADQWVDIYEFSCEPIGKPYGSFDGFHSGTNLYGTAFDDDGDVLADAPRDIEAKEALMNSIDIEVTDTTSASSAKDRLLMALPRKHFPTNSSTNPDGTSYLYPGVSDLLYKMQETTVQFLTLNLGGVGDSRSLTFPSATNNSIKNVSMITFQKDENPSGNIDQGWYNPTWNGTSKATGAQIIEQLGGLWFDEKYEPGGWCGDEVSYNGTYHGPLTQAGARPTSKANDNTYVNSVGSHIANVKSIYVGTNWNYHSTGALTVPFWDAYVSSTSSSANLNGYGTTLGNTTNYGTGNKDEDINLAKYNRMGGIYIKQIHSNHALTMIDNDSAIRWTIGTDGDEIRFRSAADESVAPTTQMTLADDGDLFIKKHAYIGNSGTQGQIIWRRNTSYDMKLFQGDSTQNSVFLQYGSVWDIQFDTTHTAQKIKRNSDSKYVDWVSFTGQHKSRHNNELSIEQHQGLIVVSTGLYNNTYIPDDDPDVGKPSINDAHPIVALSSKRNQKSTFGVVSGVGDNDADGNLAFYTGRIAHNIGQSKDQDGERLSINSIGEGAIWICNINGNFENGDYITTCEIPGYGMLQDDDLLHNYTVGKITQDCNFELDNPYYDCVEFEFEGQTYRKAFVGCTYHCG